MNKPLPQISSKKYSNNYEDIFKRKPQPKTFEDEYLCKFIEDEEPARFLKSGNKSGKALYKLKAPAEFRRYKYVTPTKVTIEGERNFKRVETVTMLKLYSVRGGLKALVDLGSKYPNLTLDVAILSTSNLLQELKGAIKELEKARSHKV